MIVPSGAYDAGTFHAITGVRARVGHFFTEPLALRRRAVVVPRARQEALT
jgi:hypothetical protein